MTFHLEIETDNAAFEINAEEEIRRILKEAARKLEDVAFPGDEVGEGITLRDINGNRVGFMRYEESK